MSRDQVFGLPNEQKHFCFFRSCPCMHPISRVFKYAITENKLESYQYKFFVQFAGPVIMRFLFLPLLWISKSLILVTNWKMSIPLSKRTYLKHCNHWPEQPSTQSEVKCVFSVSIRDTLLASTFYLAESICQDFITSSRSLFPFRLNTNSAMSIWPAVLRFSATAKELSEASDTTFLNKLC